MEFEFIKDFISGQSKVKMSMGHEAFAAWLEEEGQGISWIEALLNKIAQLQLGAAKEYKLHGSEFSLFIHQDEVQVINHSLLNAQGEAVLEENMDFYDAESQACCGLPDFTNLIESWLEFVRG